jgi:alkylated DNA repair dioxygenase AlkB
MEASKGEKAKRRVRGRISIDTRHPTLGIPTAPWPFAIRCEKLEKSGRMTEQIRLFEQAPARISGLSYVPEFITRSEALELVKHIEAGNWTHEFARRRQHYGMDYSRPRSNAPVPLPNWIESIARKMVTRGLFSRMPVQALVNEYEPGQGISAHKDYSPFDEVASLSLLSGCLMEFAKTSRRSVESIWLEPRSLIVLIGEARHEWTHAIRPRRSDWVAGEKIPRQRRLSLTLRTIAA